MCGVCDCKYWDIFCYFYLLAIILSLSSGQKSKNYEDYSHAKLLVSGVFLLSSGRANSINSTTLLQLANL